MDTEIKDKIYAYGRILTYPDTDNIITSSMNLFPKNGASQVNFLFDMQNVKNIEKEYCDLVTNVVCNLLRTFKINPASASVIQNYDRIYKTSKIIPESFNSSHAWAVIKQGCEHNCYKIPLAQSFLIILKDLVHLINKECSSGNAYNKYIHHSILVVSHILHILQNTTDPYAVVYVLKIWSGPKVTEYDFDTKKKERNIWEKNILEDNII